MANIRFSPDEVNSIASKIAASKGNVENEVNTLQSTINDLCAGWEGVASEKYRDEFQALKVDVMDKFVGMLDELQQQLISISNTMQQADQDLANQINMR